MLKHTMQNAQLAALFALAGVVSAPPAMAQDYDGNGCSILSKGCLRDSGYWEADSDSVLITQLTNNCGERIFARLCNETETGWICHEFAMSAGGTRKQHTFNATGEVEWNGIGSRSSSSDSTCRRRFPAPPR